MASATFFGATPFLRQHFWVSLLSHAIESSIEQGAACSATFTEEHYALKDATAHAEEFEVKACARSSRYMEPQNIEQVWRDHQTQAQVMLDSEWRPAG
jgi:hypothetical protein